MSVRTPDDTSALIAVDNSRNNRYELTVRCFPHEVDMCAATIGGLF